MTDVELIREASNRLMAHDLEYSLKEPTFKLGIELYALADKMEAKIVTDSDQAVWVEPKEIKKLKINYKDGKVHLEKQDFEAIYITINKLVLAHNARGKR